MRRALALLMTSGSRLGAGSERVTVEAAVAPLDADSMRSGVATGEKSTGSAVDDEWSVLESVAATLLTSTPSFTSEFTTASLSAAHNHKA